MADTQASSTEMTAEALWAGLAALRSGEAEPFGGLDYNSVVNKMSSKDCSLAYMVVTSEVMEPGLTAVNRRVALADTIDQLLATNEGAKKTDDDSAVLMGLQDVGPEEGANIGTYGVSPSNCDQGAHAGPGGAAAPAIGGGDGVPSNMADVMSDSKKGMSHGGASGVIVGGVRPLSDVILRSLSGLLGMAQTLPEKAPSALQQKAKDFLKEDDEHSEDEGVRWGRRAEQPLGYLPGQKRTMDAVAGYYSPPTLDRWEGLTSTSVVVPVGDLIKKVSADADLLALGGRSAMVQRLATQLRATPRVAVMKEDPAWTSLMFTCLGAPASPSTTNIRYPVFSQSVEVTRMFCPDLVDIATHRNLHWGQVENMVVNSIELVGRRRVRCPKPRAAAMELVVLAAAAALSMGDATRPQDPLAIEFCLRQYLFNGELSCVRQPDARYRDMFRHGVTLVAQARAHESLVQRSVGHKTQSGGKRQRGGTHPEAKSMKSARKVNVRARLPGTAESLLLEEGSA